MEHFITLYGDNVLRLKSNPVEKITEELEDLALDMIEIVKSQNAVGLAAIQISEPIQLIILKIGEEFVPVFNSKILKKSEETTISEEWCLSIPGVKCDIKRFKWVDIEYLDIENNIQTMKLEDLKANIFQHELDHMNGKLIIDYLTPARRSLIQRKLKDITKLNKVIKRCTKGQINE